jgi:hypothetical protein
MLSKISTRELAMRQYLCCWPTASFEWNIGPTDGPYLREERATGTEKYIFRILFLFVQPDFLSSPAIRVKERKYLRLKDCYSTGGHLIEASDNSYGYL